jgi:hypothetical protein
MGLLDKFKDKASELVDSAVDSAKGKVSEVTGLDADKVLDTVDSLSDAKDSLSDAADSIRDVK